MLGSRSDKVSKTMSLGANSEMTMPIFKSLNNGGSTKLNYSQIYMCSMVNQHRDAVKCRGALHNRLFRHGIELKVGKHSMNVSKEFKNHLENYYIPFCNDFITYFMEVGIVPVGTGYTLDGVPIPVVLKDNHYITVRHDFRMGRTVYDVYKMFNKNGERYKEDRKDKKATVFSGYNFDPDLVGNIRSPIMSILKTIEFSEKVTDCAMIAEENNTKLIYTTVSDRVDSGSKPFGTSIDLKTFYVDMKGPSNMASQNIPLSEEDKIAMIKYAKDYESQWESMSVTPTIAPLANPEMTKDHQVSLEGRLPSRPPVFGTPLPPGYTIVNPPRPIARADLLKILEMEDEKICSAYGIPRIMFSGESRTVGGTVMGSDMFNSTVQAWIKRLTNVLNSTFRCIYYEDMCDYYISQFVKSPVIVTGHAVPKEEPQTSLAKGREKNIKDMEIKDGKSKDGMSHDDMETVNEMNMPDSKGDNQAINKIPDINELRRMIEENEISLQFALAPSDTLDDLLKKHLMGVIDYPEFVVMVKKLSGWEVSIDDANVTPPWDNILDKVKMMMEKMDNDQKKLFSIKYPGIEDVIKNAQVKKKEPGKEEKKRKSKGKDSEEKKDKKKQKKDTSDKEEKSPKDKEDKNWEKGPNDE